MHHTKRTLFKLVEDFKAIAKTAFFLPTAIYMILAAKNKDARSGLIKLLTFTSLPVLVPAALLIIGLSVCAFPLRNALFPFELLYALGRDLFSPLKPKKSGSIAVENKAPESCDYEQASYQDEAPGHYPHPLYYPHKQAPSYSEYDAENDASPKFQ